MKKKPNPLLMSPKASLSGLDAVNGESWYEIRAAAATPGRVEIYLYEEIGRWGISAQSFINDCRDAGVFEATNVELHIHSPGGDVMHGFAIYNTMQRLTGKVDIYIDGLAASMASVIACLPNATVHMPSNAWMMIHKPWGGMAGDSDEMRDYADFLDRNESMMLTAYMQKTGLSREEIGALLKAETWMDGAEAVAKGFADVLEEPLDAAASLNQNKLKDYPNMPQAANTLFGARAQVTTPAVQVPAPAATTTPAAQHQQIDVAALAVQLQQTLQANNTARVTAVNAVFEGFPQLAALRTECVNDMSCEASVAKDRLLAKLAEGTTPSAGTSMAHIFASNGNLVGDSVRASVMNRAGHAQAEKDNPYQGLTLRELARASLVDRGIGVSGMAATGVVGLAFTHSSSDFGNILMDVAHKSALLGWEDANETFDRWTRKGTLTDFKTAHRVGLGALDKLREVKPGAEYKYITVGDKGEAIALATYGELFSIDRQTIINDDMDMLTRIPQMMGGAARYTVGELVWAVLTSNPAMSDGKALFSADHKNLVKQPLTIDGLDKARQAMLLQTNDKRKLNIRPAFMLTPVALESKANQLIKSVSVPGADANSGISNPIQNFVEVIAEARLDDNSAEAWYLTAAQGKDTIEVAYLDGIDAPYLEQQQGFTVDGAAFKVRIDAGVAPLDYRGLVKSTGKA
ncbi:ClpP-like prohead protease/major capsid protein fusion protein [Serratia plymuthica]|uniref:ClpP-like prohead protease/major capsid protein fusion protein n=1 Tax=Serratia plymuthica TaxID=82996 RepID=UPI0009359576|nr:ClpP-like prohead protease/major capsid protein fusion protein [Serratia plymuthica]OJT41514.1 peptidase S14 [Serratia plymuthica]